MSRIVIRVDAGSVPEIGTGHVIRAIKLADALRQSPVFHGFDILFATKENPPYELGGQLVKQARYKIIGNSNLEPNSKSELHSILHAKPNVVIFDRLETDANLILELKSCGIFVVTFDDLGAGQLYVDLAIHPLLQNVDSRPNVFIGYDYLFFNTDELVKSETRPFASKVFVSFGGFDSRQLSSYFLNLIPKIKGLNHYDIIVSRLDPDNLNNLVQLAGNIEAETCLRILLHQRPIDYYKLLSTSDIAIVSGGLTAFECAYAGIPAIGIPQYEHQLENFKRLERRGCLKKGTRDMELDTELLCSLVNDLSINYTERIAMSHSGMGLIDGEGLKRTVNLIAHTYC